MKKFIFLLLIFFFALNIARSQFFQGIGITGGGTLAKQKWFLNPDPKMPINGIKKKNVIGFNGSLRAEFINSEYVRWVTEFQFNQKGCKDKTDTASYTNHLNYICWNNFLKIQMEIFEGFPYLLFGPRLEYTFSESLSSPSITSNFNKLNCSVSAGIGFEKTVYSYFKPFAELHYNPDTKYLFAYQTTPLAIRNRAWELRIGIIYRPGGHDSCPAVIY